MEHIESWGILVPIIVAVGVWYLNEVSKRKWEAYKRKEESYRRLLMAVKGFYIESEDSNLKNEFIDQLNLCWLYAPDNVINKGYDFLEKMRVGNSTDKSKKVRSRALGEFVLVIREDMISRSVLKKTALRAEDFLLLQAK